MLAVWSFLAALILCIVIAVALYFIFQIKALRSSISEFILEIRSLKSSIDSLVPTASEVTSIFPAIQRVAALIPDLIEKLGLDARRTEELKNMFEQFLKFAIVSRGPAAETDNDSGFYHTTDAEAAAREESEKARKLGVNIPADSESGFYIPKRQ